jgi:hypothetical protein
MAAIDAPGSRSRTPERAIRDHLVASSLKFDH